MLGFNVGTACKLCGILSPELVEQRAILKFLFVHVCPLHLASPVLMLPIGRVGPHRVEDTDLGPAR